MKVYIFRLYVAISRNEFDASNFISTIDWFLGLSLCKQIVLSIGNDILWMKRLISVLINQLVPQIKTFTLLEKGINLTQNMISFIDNETSIFRKNIHS